MLLSMLQPRCQLCASGIHFDGCTMTVTASPPVLAVGAHEAALFLGRSPPALLPLLCPAGFNAVDVLALGAVSQKTWADSFWGGGCAWQG